MLTSGYTRYTHLKDTWLISLKNLIDKSVNALGHYLQISIIDHQKYNHYNIFFWPDIRLMWYTFDWMDERKWKIYNKINNIRIKAYRSAWGSWAITWNLSILALILWHTDGRLSAWRWLWLIARWCWRWNVWITCIQKIKMI